MTEFQKYFTTTAKGGYSNCIDRGSGSTIPNCVAWAWGWFFFDRRRTDMTKMRPRGDAKDVYNLCKPNGSGYWVSKDVKERAIACYNIGDKGHVVYVHYKLPNGQYLCSESNYSGTIGNGKYVRFLIGNPKALYKNYQGCVYDFTK